MTASPGFMAHVADCLSTFGPVTFRRMFGGAGVYADGLMFGLIDADVLHFKVDEETRAAYRAEGTGPFTYMTKHGPGSLETYWRVPERLYDDPDEMADWARRAVAVARRAASKSRAGKAKPAPALTQEPVMSKSKAKPKGHGARRGASWRRGRQS